MPTDWAKAMILPTELLVASLLWAECRCRSPFSQTPVSMLATGGMLFSSVGAQGLIWVDWAWAGLLEKQIMAATRKTMPLWRGIVLVFLYVILQIWRNRSAWAY